MGIREKIFREYVGIIWEYGNMLHRDCKGTTFPYSLRRTSKLEFSAAQGLPGIIRSANFILGDLGLF